MAQVNFYRGLKGKYNPVTHVDGIFFSTDTHEIIVNGQSYGCGIEDASYSDGVITITLVDGKKIEIPITDLTANLTEHLNKLQEDVQYIVDVTLPEMNTNTWNMLQKKVSWSDENPSVIPLPVDGAISAAREEGSQEGGVLLAQRTYDEGVTLVTEVGTTKNKLTLNASERPQIDLAGGDSQKVAYLSDVENLNTQIKDKVNTIVIDGDGTQYLSNDGTYKTLTKTTIGLGNVDNTTDLDKPISTATQNALNGKVDKETNKSLVSNDLITKLEGLDDQDTLDAAIADAKKAGTDAAALAEQNKNTIDNYTVNGHKISENPVLTKTDVGLGNVTNEAQIPLSQKGANNGVATLDESGKVPSTQLPSFVDDVLEFDNYEAFPETGESGKIYVTKDTNLEYRWSGTQYTQISKSIALGETASTAYAGDKGKKVTDRVAEVYSSSSVVNGLSDITIDSDDTEGQFLSAPNALTTWNGAKEQNDIKIPYATSQKAGVMSKDDKAKLDQLTAGIEEGTPSIKDISDRVEAIETAVGDSGTLETESKEVVGAINELKGLVDQNTTNHTELEARVQANEQNIATIQGEETVDGSIKKALKDAKDYTDSKLTWITLD